MKILQYEEYNGRVLAGVLYDDNTFATLNMVNTGNRDEILKDFYIISNDARNRQPFEGEIPTDLEEWNPPKSVAKNMIVDFYNLTGKVYDQYGSEMETEIQFSIEGENARIEDGKLVEDAVTEDMSYFIVAKCGELERRQERTIHAPVVAEEATDLQSQIEALKRELEIMKGLVG